MMIENDAYEVDCSFLVPWI